MRYRFAFQREYITKEMYKVEYDRSCPYRAAAQWEGARYAIIMRFPEGQSMHFMVDPAVLTWGSIYRFLEDIEEFGTTELRITDGSSLIYTADRPGIITHYRYAPNIYRDYPFCRRLVKMLKWAAR